MRLDTGSGMIVSKSTSDKISRRLKAEWSSGVRSDHSKKLKQSWLMRSKMEQAKIMTENLTKYNYIINNSIVVDYKGLCKLGCKSVLSSFARKKTDICIFKNVTIERVRL